MIVTTLTYIKGQPRIIVESNLGKKIIKDGIERDISIDFVGEEVNYTESDTATADDALDFLFGGES